MVGDAPGFKVTGDEVSDYLAVDDLMNLPIGNLSVLLANKDTTAMRYGMGRFCAAFCFARIVSSRHIVVC